MSTPVAPVEKYLVQFLLSDLVAHKLARKEVISTSAHAYILKDFDYDDGRHYLPTSDVLTPLTDLHVLYVLDISSK